MNRKFICNCISLACAICFLIMYCPIMSAATTNGITRADAVTWATNHASNKSVIDFDGAYGAQCVDLIKSYYSYLGNAAVKGSGKDYATNSLPSGWSRIRYYSGFVPQAGDVAVWTTGGGGHGHVAIVITANASTMTVVEQNWVGEYCSSRSNVASSEIWGVIRPDFVSISFDFVNCEDNITISGVHKFWFKQEGYGNCDVNLDLNGKALGTIYPDSNGFFSYELDSTQYLNGTYELGAIIRSTDGSEKYVTRIINIKNAKSFGFWDCKDNITISGVHKFWFKQEGYGNCDVNLDLNGKALGTIYPDSNGFFSYELDSTKYGNGQYVLGAIIRSTDGSEKYDTRTINIKNEDICATGHNYTYKVTSAPTVSAAGKLTGTCSRCSGTATVTLPKLNTNDYQYTVVTAADCTTNGIGRYAWKTTTYGNLSFDVTLAKTDHSYTEYVTEPTCTVQGYITYTCNCGNSYIGNYVDALGHTEVIDPAVIATCTSTGLSEGRHCSVCGEVLEKQKTIPATGEHQFLDGSCVNCGLRETVAGDLNGNGNVDDSDVEYLLWNTLFPDLYPVGANADFDNDSEVNDADVEYLLWHTLFPDLYPLN